MDNTMSSKVKKSKIKTQMERTVSIFNHSRLWIVEVILNVIETKYLDFQCGVRGKVRACSLGVSFP